jgi:hypothetical protein
MSSASHPYDVWHENSMMHIKWDRETISIILQVACVMMKKVLFGSELSADSELPLRVTRHISLVITTSISILFRLSTGKQSESASATRLSANPIVVHTHHRDALDCRQH